MIVENIVLYSLIVFVFCSLIVYLSVLPSVCLMFTDFGLQQILSKQKSKTFEVLIQARFWKFMFSVDIAVLYSLIGIVVGFLGLPVVCFMSALPSVC